MALTSMTWPFTARDVDGHTDWCARTHLCNLGEHRAQPVTIEVPGRGRIVLTRVQAATGGEYVEIRARIGLASGAGPARAHLLHILAEFDTCLRRVIRVPRLP